MDTRSRQGQTAPTIEHQSPRRGGRRWLALYLSWTAAMMAGAAGTAHAGMPDDPKTMIPDAACGPAHDPDHDRDHRFHKRCEHYRHRHAFHRSRAGNATIGVRTLLDVQKNAVFEATTGSFDDDSAPNGVIDHMQLTIMRGDRKHHDEMNFKLKPAAGYFSAPMGHMGHGQAMNVDAFIKGVDKGNDHLSVDDTVQYRPDLAVGRIDVPATASMGLPTSIAATVREMMGDLGATADCVLSADGAVVDRVPSIWVDAGGVVTCHFTATFKTAGQHRLHVDVGNVRPGDYDMRNNGADAMVSLGAGFAFTASAYDATYSGADVTQVLDANGNVLYVENATFSGSVQSASLNGSWGMPVTFPLRGVSVMANSGGDTWSLVDLSNLPAGSTDPSNGTCAAGSDTSGFNWITVCTANVNGAPATSVAMSEFAGEVTYHSDGVCQQTTALADCAGGFSWNNGGNQMYAPRHPFNGSLNITLNVTDSAGANLQAFPSMPMTAFVSQYDSPQSCDPLPDGTQNCSKHTYLETGVQATVNP